MRNRIVSVWIGLFIAAVMVNAGCQTAERYKASGLLHGEDIDTSLDSPMATYYLSNYLQGDRSDPLIDLKIDALHDQEFKDVLPDRDKLMRISERYSVDVAALFFADLVARDSKSAAFRARYDHYLSNIDAEQQSDRYNRYVILFVPGWDYIKSGHLTGSDLAQPRRLITDVGIENQLVEINPHGSVEANAAVIVNYMLQYGDESKRVIVAGASSAGPAIYLALNEIRNRNARAPAAWINLGGILRGSPLYEHYRQFPRS